MIRDSASHRYGKLSITLRWLMLTLFVGVYACIEIKGLLPKGHALKGLFLGLHGLFGLSIFVLVWVRLLGRLTPLPPITPALPKWQAGVSHLMHLALYGLMIATPLLAWLMLSVGGKPMPWFEFSLPSPVAVNPNLAKQFKYWHELFGSTGYWLIGLHAAAGLLHHYWVRDNTLMRMLPSRSGNAVNQRQR
ncbi:cytochrome b [Pseudomonas sp. ANT_H12B]|uniref:cytochrome b n=1 Tax=Pseudomonas sp. ANT_H12B TaxID=2597348 RepID=UPI0011EE08C5|nr:cytochrome b [Pseudomonas sp. ANT_H12B]KAA0980278.1 cytochrome b [Pseudomonas sp. ANT_H12B]